MFNKVILAASAAILFSGSAMAADAVVYNAPAPAYVAPVNTFSWDGAYAGVNLGYGFGRAKDATGLVDIKPRGFIGGVQAGYNWQFDKIVAGIEVDFQGSGMKKSADGAVERMNRLQIVDRFPSNNTAKVQYFGTVRGRLGTTIGERTLVYGTAGLAYGKVKVDGDSTIVPVKASKNLAGYTVGAGVEYAFTDKITLKSEYLYTDLGQITITPLQPAKVNFHTVRVGVNYKF